MAPGMVSKPVSAAILSRNSALELRSWEESFATSPASLLMLSGWALGMR